MLCGGHSFCYHCSGCSRGSNGYLCVNLWISVWSYAWAGLDKLADEDLDRQREYEQSLTTLKPAQLIELYEEESFRITWHYFGQFATKGDICR